jgi:hypothetical protein
MAESALIQKARALMFTRKLPKEFWGAAKNTAVVLHNTTPAVDAVVTPHELFNGYLPDTIGILDVRPMRSSLMKAD